MRSEIVLLPLLAGCASVPQIPPHHIGPVTGIGCGDRVLQPNQVEQPWPLICSCSQAGVFLRLRDHGSRRPNIGDAGLRAFDLVVQNRPFTGLRILVGGGQPGRSGEVALLDEDGKVVARKQVARDLVYAVDAHGALAVAGCASGKVVLLKWQSLEIVRELHGHTAPCRDVAFSRDGRLVASGGRDGLVIVSRVDGGQPTVLEDHTAGVECVAFSQNGLLASGALDGKVRIHEGRTLRRTYQKLGGEVLSLAYAGEQSGCLFAGLANGTLVRLDPDSARHAVYRDVKAPVFAMAAHGKTLALGLDGEILVLDL